MYKCSEERMKDKIETFSKYGDAGHGGITRYSLSEAAIKARNEFVKRMTAIGATIETDDVANMYATIPGSDPEAKRIVMASHVDSVKNGGNYDGILGVMSAMEVLATKSMLDPTKTFGEALDKSGFKGERKNRISPEKYQYMFETHIEQGPILEDNNRDIGVVDCVLGMFNYRVKFYGQTVHAGTFPMPKRRDALYAASKALCYLHEKIDKLAIPELVYTTGEIVLPPMRTYLCAGLC